MTPRFIDEIVNEVLNRLFTIARAKSDISGNDAQIEGIAGENRDCKQLALPGFSSGTVPEDVLLILRRRSGAYSIGCLSHCPGEEPGDRNIWLSNGFIFRLRDQSMKVIDPSAQETFVVDSTIPTIPNPANPLATSLLPVARQGDGIMLGGMAVPNAIVATSLEVKAK